MIPPQGLAAILEEALVVYKGTTTANGAGDGSTLICAALAALADYDGNQVIVTSGTYNGQARDINGTTLAGTVTPANNFGGQIPINTSFIITGIRTVPAEVAALQADVGDASASTLGSLYDILGDPAQDFLAMIGYEGATSLADKLTAARAGYLEYINNVNLETIADISTLTATEIGYLDENISAAKTLTTATVDAIRKSVCLTGDTASSIGKILFDLNAGLTAARMGHLDEINAAALAQDAGSVAANAQVDSLVRAIADVVRGGGTGDLAAILEYSQMLSRPAISLYEGWLDETGIDATVWTVTDPATGVAWSRDASGAYLRATAAPNTGEHARLVSDQRYIVAPGIYGTNTILRNFTLEFELKLTTPGNIEEAETFLGLTTATGHKRSDDDIIGWAILSDVLQSVSKEAANEENNTTFGETLTNWNKLKIEVCNGNIGFFINENPVASHTTRLPSFPFYLNFYYEADGGAGAATIELGIIRIWQEDFVR